MNDLEIQRERAAELAEMLYDFMEVREVEEDGETFHVADLRVNGLLDALGCCGFVLQPGVDAGMALMDNFAKRAK
jgi:hypothetical protein